jgi:ABC-type uncharacterized transport system substrate-binding protein
MRRRELLLICAFAVGLLASSSRTHAQQAGKTYRLAVLSQTAPSLAIVRAVILPELARAGFVDGSNLVISYHTGPADELPGLAAKAVADNPDAILAIATPAAAAARATTDTIPIVSLADRTPCRKATRAHSPAPRATSPAWSSWAPILTPSGWRFFTRRFPARNA